MKPNRFLFKTDKKGYLRLEQQEEQTSRPAGATTVRLCVCTDCVNNRAGVGEYGCNCKEIEIQEGKCRQYLKQQTPPLKIT